MCEGAGCQNGERAPTLMGEIVIELKGNPSAQTLGSTETCQTAAHSLRTYSLPVDIVVFGNRGMQYMFLI